MGILFRGKAADIGHDRLVEDCTELWELLPDDPVHTRILQSDGIQHAGGSLRNARRRVSEAGLSRGPLEGKCTELIDIIELCKFVAIAEGPARRDHRVIEPDPAERDSKAVFGRGSRWIIGVFVGIIISDFKLHDLTGFLG